VVSTLADFAGLLSAETVSGGSGNDILSITATGSVAATDLLGLSSVETISLASTSTHSVTLSDAVFTANGVANLAITDGEATAAGITVNATGVSAGNSISVTTANVAGNDSLVGGAGNDTFTMAVANGVGTLNSTDVVTGGTGSDTLRIGTGGTSGTIDLAGVTGIETISATTITGGAVTDTITFAAIPDTLVAAGATLTMNFTGRTGSIIFNATNSEADGFFSIVGSSAADTIYGGALADTIDGGDGADTIQGGSGADSIVGNAGGDTILGGNGSDTLTGGSGSDVFQYTAVTQSGGSAIDTITDFSTTDDQLQVTLNYSSLQAGVTVNATRLTAVSSLTDAQAALSGERGQYVYDTSSSKLYINFNNDNLLTSLDYSIVVNAASTATATVASTDIDFTVTGTALADVITTDGGADTITGGAGADSITGGAGNDSITGGDDADTITGGAGADAITVGAGNDVVIFSAVTDGLDTITDTGATNGDLDIGDTSGDVLTFKAFVTGGAATVADTTGAIAGAAAAGTTDAQIVTAASTLWGAGTPNTLGIAVLTNDDVATTVTATTLQTAFRADATHEGANSGTRLLAIDQGTYVAIYAVANTTAATDTVVTEVVRLTGVADITATTFFGQNFDLA